MATPDSVLALDVGERRIGVAVASFVARLPRPLTTLEHDNTVLTELLQIVEAESITHIVVGLPRGLSGQYTDQTASVEMFASQLGQQLKRPIHMQDEALTSKQAEAELDARRKPYNRGDIDALAATYILEDFLKQNPLEAGHVDAL